MTLTLHIFGKRWKILLLIKGRIEESWCWIGNDIFPVGKNIAPVIWRPTLWYYGAWYLRWVVGRYDYVSPNFVGICAGLRQWIKVQRHKCALMGRAKIKRRQSTSVLLVSSLFYPHKKDRWRICIGNVHSNLLKRKYPSRSQEDSSPKKVLVSTPKYILIPSMRMVSLLGHILVI